MLHFSFSLTHSHHVSLSSSLTFFVFLSSIFLELNSLKHSHTNSQMTLLCFSPFLSSFLPSACFTNLMSSPIKLRLTLETYGPFGLSRREGEYSKVNKNWLKISLFLVNFNLLLSLSLNPNKPLMASSLDELWQMYVCVLVYKGHVHPTLLSSSRKSFTRQWTCKSAALKKLSCIISKYFVEKNSIDANLSNLAFSKTRMHQYFSRWRESK